jgi:hypothetical protein
LSHLATALITIAVPTVLRWIYTRSATGKAVVEHDCIVFSESKVVSIIRWGGLLGFSAAAVASWTFEKSVLATSIWAGFAIIALLARGDSIVVNRDGISGASTWGRRAALAWGEVASLEYRAGAHNTIVMGKNGAKICHSGFHLDQTRFEEEVKRRTGLPIKVIQPGVWKSKISYR